MIYADALRIIHTEQLNITHLLQGISYHTPIIKYTLPYPTTHRNSFFYLIRFEVPLFQQRFVKVSINITSL